jgi:hypothetical protein
MDASTTLAVTATFVPPERVLSLFRADGVVVLHGLYIVSHGGKARGPVQLTVGDTEILSSSQDHRWGNHEQVNACSPVLVLDQAEIIFRTESSTLTSTTFTVLALYSPTSAKARLVRVPLEPTRPKPDPEKARRLLSR